VQVRYWDGTAWTEHTSPHPTATVDSAPPLQPVIDLTTERRQVHGNDILYVRAADGSKVGYLNLSTGKVALDQPTRSDDFHQAVETWRSTQSATIASETAHGAQNAPTNVDEPPRPPIDQPQAETVTPWVDLATNQPGEGPRAKSLELQQTAPVRTFVARLVGVHTDERAWRVGAKGEQEVGRRLTRLPEPWRVLHGIPIGERGSDIDHVVIGPGGVYTLNTKNHPNGKVWVAEKAILVNGQKVPYLRNSRLEASRASARLSTACGFAVDAEPIIVVMARELEIKAMPADVHVVARLKIAKWLTRRAVRLSDDVVGAIYEHARRDVTWRSR
jgi:hypothetical protein